MKIHFLSNKKFIESSSLKLKKKKKKKKKNLNKKIFFPFLLFIVERTIFLSCFGYQLPFNFLNIINNLPQTFGSFTF